MIDTNVAIHLRDGDEAIFDRVQQLPAQPVISVVTQVELEGGIDGQSPDAVIRRARLHLMLEAMEVLPFTSEEARVYGQIVEQRGYSRRMMVDRMIAASAIVAEATLITANGADFEGIDKLKLEIW